MTKPPDGSTELSHHIPSSALPRTIDGAVRGVFAHATSAARLVGHPDDAIVGPLANHVGAMAHVLSELLGDPCAFAASVRGAHSRLAAGATPKSPGGTGGVR